MFLGFCTRCISACIETMHINSVMFLCICTFLKNFLTTYLTEMVVVLATQMRERLHSWVTKYFKLQHENKKETQSRCYTCPKRSRIRSHQSTEIPATEWRRKSGKYIHT